MVAGELRPERHAARLAGPREDRQAIQERRYDEASCRTRRVFDLAPRRREAVRLFPEAEILVVSVTRHVVPWVVRPNSEPSTRRPSYDLPIPGLDEDQLSARAEEAGLDNARVLMRHGDPAGAICAAAEEHDVDVVVIGSHDKGVLQRLLDPSVAHAVVQGTYRPVLVVSGDALVALSGSSTPESGRDPVDVDFETAGAAQDRIGRYGGGSTASDGSAVGG